MKRSAILSVCVALLAFSTLAVAAPPEGKGKPDKGHHKESQSSADPDGGGSGGHQDRDSDGYGSFDEDDFRLFAREQHYGGYDALPPGIRKNLARGKPLPPGIARREIPPELMRRLPLRDGYEWRAVGSDVVLYSITSGIVDQVLRDVFFD